jgi:hypothetical protein
LLCVLDVHDRVEWDRLDGLKELEATLRVEEVGCAILASALNASLNLVGAPVAVAFGALKNKCAYIG